MAVGGLEIAVDGWRAGSYIPPVAQIKNDGAWIWSSGEFGGEALG
jgi:hypothetical protein